MSLSITGLPKDVLFHTLSFLPSQDLAHTVKVTKAWNSASLEYLNKQCLQSIRGMLIHIRKHTLKNIPFVDLLFKDSSILGSKSIQELQQKAWSWVKGDITKAIENISNPQEKIVAYQAIVIELAKLGLIDEALNKNLSTRCSTQIIFKKAVLILMERNVKSLVLKLLPFITDINMQRELLEALINKKLYDEALEILNMPFLHAHYQALHIDVVKMLRQCCRTAEAQRYIRAILTHSTKSYQKEISGPILNKIFTFLSISQLASICSVNRKWKDTAVAYLKEELLKRIVFILNSKLAITSFVVIDSVMGLCIQSSLLTLERFFHKSPLASSTGLRNLQERASHWISSGIERLTQRITNPEKKASTIEAIRLELANLGIQLIDNYPADPALFETAGYNNSSPSTDSYLDQMDND